MRFLLELNAAPSTSSTTPQVINLDIIWNKIPSTVLQKCQEEKQLTPSDKTAITSVIVDYLLNGLKCTKRVDVKNIAEKVCQKFPKSFSNSINQNETWDDGTSSFFLKVYNAVLYGKKKNDISNQKRKRRESQNDKDSDDEAEEQRLREKNLRKKQDTYGCINYAPLLTEDETSEAQDASRRQLMELFSSNQNDNNINNLMMKTYPTLRATINDPNLDIGSIIENWPFIQIKEHFIAHSNHLMGKNLVDVWTGSLDKRVKITGQYLKSLKHEKEIQDQRDTLINEAKSACIVRKDRIPKYLVVLKLLVQYFKEDDNFLFKITQVRLQF